MVGEVSEVTLTCQWNTNFQASVGDALEDSGTCISKGSLKQKVLVVYSRISFFYDILYLGLSSYAVLTQPIPLYPTCATTATPTATPLVVISDG